MKARELADLLLQGPRQSSFWRIATGGFLAAVAIASAGCSAQPKKLSWEEQTRKEIREANVALLASHEKEIRQSYEEKISYHLNGVRKLIENDSKMPTLDKRAQLRRFGNGQWKFSDPIPSETTIGAFTSVVTPALPEDAAARWKAVAFFSEDGKTLQSLALAYPGSSSPLTIYDRNKN